jgi:ribosomal protein S18 acetylase RimI-like enzyme
MNSAPTRFTFLQVPSKLAEKAFAFHESISSTNEHIWPRTEEEIKEYSESGQLLGVYNASTGEFAGLCYVTLEGDEWETGGLTVTEKNQGLHLGSALIRFALAHTIAYYRPWRYGQEIIAHVHEDNAKPRNLLQRIGFEFVKKVEIPGDVAPPSMRRNAEGKVPGDKFRFPPKAVVQLSEWFADDFLLADGKTPGIFEIQNGTIDSLREDLKQAVEDLGLAP